MRTATVGIDIAKDKFDVARLGADGKYKHKKFPNTSKSASFRDCCAAPTTSRT